MLTARTESFLWGRRDLDDTIRRLQVFAEAGAEVLYAPGLPDLDSIRKVCEIGKPVNDVMGLPGARFTVVELAAAGVKRKYNAIPANKPASAIQRESSVTRRRWKKSSAITLNIR